MKKARAMLVTLLLAALCIRVVWWTIAPMIPYVTGALVVVTILGYIMYRATRW